VADDIAISVRGLTKTYRLFDHPGDRIKQALTLGMRKYHRKFTALKDVSLDVKRGEAVGIIGRNGSGKSTLLQLACGILKPSSGVVDVHGKVSALLELGAGFNPEFTGRENIYFQGALMGLNQADMDARMDEITAFADIGEFVDQQVRTYSSGMFVRLAFAVAVHVEPEILVVDEALGVGDAEFQERSISRMKSLLERGMTILFVSHSIPVVRNFCHRAVWLDSGIVRQIGRADEVCHAYQLEIDERLLANNEASLGVDGAPRQHPSGRAKHIAIMRATIDQANIEVGGSLTMHFDLDFASDFDPATEFGFGVIIRNKAGRLIAVLNTMRDDVALLGDVRKITLQLPRIAFIPGRYWISANVCDREVLYAYDERDDCLSFVVANVTSRRGLPRWEGDLACDHAWLI
jgi:ABC-type polysaccharide/polyol phosphate transport system ATPase subunit